MTPWLDDGDVQLYHGDVVDVLRQLPAGIAQTCVTSPPYWGLRDYGTGTWTGGDAACDHRTDAKPDRKFTNGRGEGQGDEYAGSNLRSWTTRDAMPADGICGRCGARRVDSQLGLEATPELYVERLVTVFREVWRVLRDDGTVWLNLGDSYAGGGPSNHGGGASTLNNDGRPEQSRQDILSRIRDTAGAAGRSHVATAPGLKPKDLCGIPWKVAFALQQPWYSGTIKNEADRRWLAATIDAEGCIYISRSKEGAQTGRDRKYQRTQDAFDVAIKITNTSTAMLEEVKRLVGHGNIRQSADHGRPAYEWTLYSSKARELLRELYPHFIVKAHEARLAHGCPPSGDQAAATHEALKAIHQGGTPDIDYGPPRSMFERGWCLRSDVIWAKCIPNPMPESVSDRPTKAHEYLFLLAKRPRYFYDADAIREAWTDERNGASGAAWSKYGDRGVTNAPTTAGRNRRSVWTIATEPFPEAHFATYPQALVRPCILAGTSERGECVECGAPWVRETETTLERTPKGNYAVAYDERDRAGHATNDQGSNRDRDGHLKGWVNHVQTTGWRASCTCEPDVLPFSKPQTVLDPFIGSGTTALVARNHGRRCIGIDLSSEYLAIAARRLQQLSLLGDPA